MGLTLLTERHADQIAGVVLCLDRALIFGTLPQICAAEGMSSYLYEALPWRKVMVALCSTRLFRTFGAKRAGLMGTQIADNSRYSCLSGRLQMSLQRPLVLRDHKKRDSCRTEPLCSTHESTHPQNLDAR
jgi:hypothetical protein